VNVKGFLLAIRFWHELSKSDLTQGFVERVKLLLVSLWKAMERPFPKGIIVQERLSGWL